MRVLNKNGIHFVVADDIEDLRISANFEFEGYTYSLEMSILEDAVLLLTSSKSNRWDDNRLNPFLNKDNTYIKYLNCWHIYKCGSIKESVSIDNIKNTADVYDSTPVEHNYTEYEAINTYTMIKDDIVYNSFEDAIINAMSISWSEVYSIISKCRLLNTFSDTHGNKLMSYYMKWTTLDKAVKDKYDIAMINDSDEKIKEFIGNGKIVKCLLSYGKGINKVEAVAYCNTETLHTLIVNVNSRVVEDTVIYDELDNCNIYGKGHYINIRHMYLNDYKNMVQYSDCLRMGAFNIAREISSNTGTKCVLTSNPVIAYQLVTGKNVTTAGFWKDVDGNSLKKYFKKTATKQLSVTHEHTQKIEGLGEVINEVLGPLVETVNNLADTVNNLAETVAAKTAADEVMDVTETNKEDGQTKVMESSEYTIDNFTYAVQGVDAEELEQLCYIKPAIMLQSYPGTGKTTTAIEFAKYITKETNSDRVLLLSFNQETSYTDTIGGVRRVDAVSDWKYVPGLLYNICDRAYKDKGNPYVVILDEINRANTAGVLGELISAMSKRNTEIITNSGRHIVVPNNLIFIGTMNSFDESTTKIDSALQDRFMIYNMPAVYLDCNKIKKYKEKELGKTLPENIVDGLEILANAIRKVNEQLRKHPYFGDDNQIGNRALYNNHCNVSDLLLTLKYDIKPKVACKYNELDTHIVDEIKRILKDAEIQLNVLCEKDK